MHDYHEAMKIIEYSTEQAKKEEKSKVAKIHLVIGDSSSYSEDSIRMYLEQNWSGTVCEGAELCARTVKTMLHCPKCGELFERKPFHYECPKCGTEGEPSDIGKEMEIESLEFE
jgi:hydrogenase nickel incorporation protein HypA/HybF